MGLGSTSRQSQSFPSHSHPPQLPLLPLLLCIELCVIVSASEHQRAEELLKKKILELCI